MAAPKGHLKLRGDSERSRQTSTLPPPATRDRPPDTRAAAVVVAAGRGRRFGASDKVLMPLAGRPMLAYVLDALEHATTIAAVVLVVGQHTRVAVERLVAAGPWTKVRAVVVGGERRQDSVAAGVAALPTKSDIVVVHDGARPLVPPALFDRCARAAATTGAAIAAVPVADTLKRVVDTRVVGTVDREALWAAQTPQAFRRSLIEHVIARGAGQFLVTDEAGLCEALGLPVEVVPGSPSNLKITHPEDIAVAEALLRAGPPAARSHGEDEGGAAADVGQAIGERGSLDPRELRTPQDWGVGGARTGIGYDAHRFAPGRRLVLGGVTIRHPYGLAGHSDADVLLHAIADALLGAAALGDIGRHFPPTDPLYEDADSRDLLRRVGELVAAAGYVPVNVDATVIAEAPRIGPHVPAMRATIAASLGLPEAAVGVKATTNEGMGFVGRGEGIAALATATLMPVLVPLGTG